MKIELKNVSLNIPIYDNFSITQSFFNIFKQKVFNKKITKSSVGGNIVIKEKKKYVNVINNLSLTLNSGDSIGVIGHNGSGKSSLLKLIAGIYKPYYGEVKTKGKIFSLFSSNIGMDVDLTGIENIILKCKMNGIDQKQTNNIMDDVISFCDIGEFINMPIRTYSSGMVIRLSYALTTAFDYEIILIDENLDAGDKFFQEKMANRNDKFYNKVKILVMVTHNLEKIKKFCNKCMIMQKGKMVMIGKCDDVIRKYERNDYGY